MVYRGRLSGAGLCLDDSSAHQQAYQCNASDRDEFLRRAGARKLKKAIELLKSAREAKIAAERDANRLREQLEQREEDLDSLRSEVVALRKEREEVRARVEKMVKRIDQLVAEA